MKILQITYGLASGGAERFLTDLLNQLAERDDIEITLLLISSKDVPRNMFYAKELSKKIRVKSLGLSHVDMSVFTKLSAAVRQENPDIVHIHLSPIILFCILPILFFRKPVYMETLHNEVARIDNGSKLKRVLKSFVYKTGLIKVCTISDKNAREYKKVYGRKCDAMIYNGRKALAKTSAYENVQNEVNGYKLDNKTVVLTHIARCAKQKNQDLLIDSFNAFSSDKNVILLIIGNHFDSEEGLRLKAKANRKIYFLGEKHNIQDYLYCSDAFVLSSLYEGMPITLIEALSCACIPLSTPVSGVVDIVRDGENGFISKGFSQESFVSMLDDFWHGRERIDKDALVQLFANKLSIESCANSYFNFYQKCLQSKTKR